MQVRRIRVSDLRRVIREEFERQALNEWYETPDSFEDFVKNNNVAVKGIKKEIDRIAASYQASGENSEILNKVVSAGTAEAMRGMFNVMQKAVWSSSK